MVTKLFVGSLPYSATQNQLQDLFAQAGKVVSCSLITDRFSGQSKGFAFVEMESEQEANEAIKKFNDYELDGRKIVVNIARPREDGDRRDFGGNRGFSRGPRR